jgi:hypothetical protein
MKLVLGAFEKLQKAAIIFAICPSVCLFVFLSVRSRGTTTERTFKKFDISVFFEYLSRIFKFL